MPGAAFAAPGAAPSVDRERLAAIGFVLTSLVIIAGVFALPLVLLLGVSIVDANGLTFANYKRLLGTPYYLGVVWNSLRLRLLTTLIAFLLSYPAPLPL